MWQLIIASVGLLHKASAGGKQQSKDRKEESRKKKKRHSVLIGHATIRIDDTWKKNVAGPGRVGLSGEGRYRGPDKIRMLDQVSVTS